MNKKNIAKALNAKLNNWLDHIDDNKIKTIIRQNAIITGGALVSLLNGETPNDYDVYFKTKESCLAVAEYYANKWNETHKDKNKVEILVGDYQWIDGKKTITNKDRITCFIKSKGFAIDKEESAIDDSTEPIYDGEPYVEDESKEEKPKYRPRYFSTNAISLSDKIQLVIRFYGSVEEIHKNYDFVHCTCSYDFLTNKVNLPNKALESIINKELYYNGSRYPLCSIIRTRKFISRGWTINAGQYLKMCLQLNELNLKDFYTFKDQLTGVDSAYFDAAMESIEKKLINDPNYKLDNTYLFEIINRLF